ncbi:MAG: hypothetical protein ABII22_04170 [Candidatus Micrarchaeota archaeon]
MILITILRFLGAIVSAIGTLLVFLGALGSPELMFTGVSLIMITAAFDVLTVKYENKKKLEKISNDFVNWAGMQFAIPALILLLYFLSSDRELLVLALAFGIMSFFNVAANTVKVYISENSLEKTRAIPK